MKKYLLYIYIIYPYIHKIQNQPIIFIHKLTNLYILKFMFNKIHKIIIVIFS